MKSFSSLVQAFMSPSKHALHHDSTVAHCNALVKENENLHRWVKVDQAGRPLPPKTPSILAGLTLKRISLCNPN